MRNKNGEISVVHQEPALGHGQWSAEQYDEAIAALQDAKEQLSPDGRNCIICHDGGHQAWECTHNPLTLAHRASQVMGIEGSALPWRCFACGQVFTDYDSALEHFGDNDGKGQPSCVPKYPGVWVKIAAVESPGVHPNVKPFRKYMITNSSKSAPGSPIVHPYVETLDSYMIMRALGSAQELASDDAKTHITRSFLTRIIMKVVGKIHGRKG